MKLTAQALAAEVLGTALLTAATFGTALMARELTTDAGLALLVNSLATGAALLVLITVLGPVSGAHMNPAVSLVMALTKALRPAHAAAYIAAQCAGAVAGVVLTHAMFAQPLLQTATTHRAGTGLWLAEVVATFGLILTILGATRAKANTAGMVAAYITSAYWFTASTSFANPAVTLARTLTTSPAAIAAPDAPAYVAAQIAGALLAAALGTWLFRPKA